MNWEKTCFIKSILFLFVVLCFMYVFCNCSEPILALKKRFLIPVDSSWFNNGYILSFVPDECNLSVLYLKHKNSVSWFKMQISTSALRMIESRKSCGIRGRTRGKNRDQTRCSKQRQSSSAVLFRVEPAEDVAANHISSKWTGVCLNLLTTDDSDA